MASVVLVSAAAAPSVLLCSVLKPLVVFVTVYLKKKRKKIESVSSFPWAPPTQAALARDNPGCQSGQHSP